ncbi:MAG: hypothetical protein R3C02_03240 [Planctomycetaceae bacterium]
MIPPGQSIIVSAPLAGTLASPDGGEISSSGFRVEAGQAVFKFIPLLSAGQKCPQSGVERIQMANARASLVSSQLLAEGDVNRGKAEVEAANVALERAKQLLTDRVGSQESCRRGRRCQRDAQKSLEAAQQPQVTA